MFQLPSCCSLANAHLVGMFCTSNVECFEDGVGCAKECQITRHRHRSVQWSILRPPSRPHYVLHIAIAIWSPPNMTCHRHVFEASSTEPYYINPIALLRPLAPDLYIYHPPVSARPTTPPDKSMANTNIVTPSGD